MSDSEDDNIPDAKTCEERCQYFAQITGTDTALAQFYLQDRAWNLERSVNAYFEENNEQSANNDSTPVPRPISSQKKPIAAANSDAADGGEPSSKKSKPSQASAAQSDVEKLVAAASKQSQDNPKRLRVLSWNIDGLDQNNIKNRTLAVCQTVNEEDPDVVYLQEVVPQSLEILEEKCPLYQVIPAGHTGYFTAMMLKVGTVEYDEHTIKPFNSSMMTRNLLKVKATVKGVKFLLLTTHLESTKHYATERKSQLKIALKEMIDCPDDCNALLGGDLNLRDTELQEIGGLPEKILDIWEVTGKRPEAKFTWDLMRNDNLNWENKFKPRCRFDRFLFRHSAAKKLKPVYFELVGIQRLKSCKRFASDHWGILSHYDKT